MSLKEGIVDECFKDLGQSVHHLKAFFQIITYNYFLSEIQFFSVFVYIG